VQELPAADDPDAGPTSQPASAGFMSGNQQQPDMICAVFVLAANDVLR
jgi:hypothetical protein